MKSNKKGSASIGIVVILIAIVLMLVSVVIYLYSNGKIPAKDDTIVSGDKGNSNTSNVDEQIDLIVNNYSMWTMKTDDDTNKPYSYVVTDLDQNGRLEIIASTCQGTGIYTYSKYYEVNDTFDGLYEIKRVNYVEGASEPDIGVKTVKVFIDRDKNVYYYIFDDVIRDGAAIYYENRQDIMLKDGMLFEDNLAYKTTVYKDGVSEITYQDTELNNITAEDFENAGEKKFKGLESETVNFEWITQDGDDLDNVSIDELKTLLKKSYDGFKFSTSQVSTNETEDNKIRHEAYKVALKELMTSKKLPAGEDIEIFFDGSNGATSMEENQFAIYDIDGDGHDELIICWVTAPTAGQLSFIYDYDVNLKKFVSEFNDVPLLTFYDNGVIVALLSHNQGLAGDSFWPYFLYKYNKDSDVYDQIAMVDAWDKTVAASNYEGDKYPEDDDKSGDGIVYYVITDGDYDNRVPVSKEYYENWRRSYLDGAVEIKPEFIGFSEKNIEDIK